MLMYPQGGDVGQWANGNYPQEYGYGNEYYEGDYQYEDTNTYYIDDGYAHGQQTQAQYAMMQQAALYSTLAQGTQAANAWYPDQYAEAYYEASELSGTAMTGHVPAGVLRAV